MKRWLVRIAVLLVLGAIVNIAVAWRCSRWSRLDVQPNGIVGGFGISATLETQSPIGKTWPGLSSSLSLGQPQVGWPVRTANLHRWPTWSPWFDRSFNDMPISFIGQGFAINTLFYAAILWMLFAFPFKVRYWRRIKRGLCPACAYPVGISPVCTECGEPVTPRSVEPS